VSDDQVRRAMIEQFNLRIGANMAKYVQLRLLRRELSEVPIIGGDARTGVAIRQIIALDVLRRATTAPSSA
jgi:hypothetical protein